MNDEGCGRRLGLGIAIEHGIGWDRRNCRFMKDRWV